MMRCPDCADGRLNEAYGIYRGLACCKARALAGTPRKRQKAVADSYRAAYPADWDEIRADALAIMDERKAQRLA
jgi:hypothetical protein